ncbi:four helix bundle protein [Microcoleus sp. CAWBG58]|uniref:four helix bundle protein n=1 Tax=Microcoleus sp. CAWBG58 TaxID=2841651 RepID=UPI0025DB4218|nr:four helix bundle protein [Microcoleus sp. CAWBG58]
MGRPDFEELEVYKLAESLANQIWEIVKKWDYFTKDTMGKQIVRSADSVCGNIAEGRGRYNDPILRTFLDLIEYLKPLMAIGMSIFSMFESSPLVSKKH